MPLQSHHFTFTQLLRKYQKKEALLDSGGKKDGRIYIFPSDRNCSGITGIWLCGYCPLSTIGQWCKLCRFDISVNVGTSRDLRAQRRWLIHCPLQHKHFSHHLHHLHYLHHLTKTSNLKTILFLHGNNRVSPMLVYYW